MRKPQCPRCSKGMDKAHPQTALGTALSLAAIYPFRCQILLAPLSGEATGGEVCPALNSRLL